MSWSLTVQSIAVTSTGVAVQCVLTDGVSRKIVQSFLTDGTTASLRAQARAAVTQLDVIQAKGDLSVNQLIDLAPDPVTPPPDPTQEQLAQQKFVVALQTERQQARLKLLSPELQQAAADHPEYLVFV